MSKETTTTRPDTAVSPSYCPTWCSDRGNAEHEKHGTDHYAGDWDAVPATAGTFNLSDVSAEFSVGSVNVYQERRFTTPKIMLDVHQVDGDAKRWASLHLRPDEAARLGRALIDAAGVLSPMLEDGR